MSRKKRHLTRKKKNQIGVGGRVLSPLAAEQIFNEALNAFQSGNLADAALKADRLIASASVSSQLFHFRGLIEINQLNFNAAIRFFREGLAIEPNSTKLSDSMGTALSEMGQLDDAIASYRRALLNDTRNAGALNNLGMVLHKKGEWDKSEKAFRDSLIYRPDNFKTRLNLAEVLLTQEKFDAAETLYWAMIEDDNQFIDGYRMLGECLMSAQKWEAALSLAESGIAAGLNDAEIYNLKSYALGALTRFEEAEVSIRKAIKMEPNNAQAKIALSILCFYQEKWPIAWENYEARWGLPTMKRRPFTQAMWSGQPLAGKKLLVWGEQGVGDEVMYASMISDVLTLGAKVTLEVDARLVPLFARSFPKVKCVARCLNPADYILNTEFDYQIPIASLGQYLRKEEASFGAGARFLLSDKVKTDELRQKYKVADDLIIGITWYSSDSRGLSKSMSLQTLKPLFEVPNVQFVDLQYGDQRIERQAFEKTTGFTLVHDDNIDQMKSIDDFAAQISALDLVISISNTTAHIAGALGVPTWVMLGAAPMRRWLINRSDCPWYASVELIRQRNKDDEAYVVEIIKNRLKELRH
jgi:tetratricopeptide (TPR) repeat protein